MPAVRSSWTFVALATLSSLACGGGPSEPSAPMPTSTSPPSTAAVATTTTTTAAPAVDTTTAAPAVDTTAPSRPTQEVRIRVDRRTADAATAGFDAIVRETLTDPRGWERAGFAFTFAADAPFAVVLAEGDVVGELCRPYDVYGRYSCQNGPVVALNADRWRTATPQWTGTLDGYRRMLVNHEVGHLLGQHHPDVQCPASGEPAPVMAQQSTELDGCLPNPWPLAWEARCAALRLEPLAPGYEPDPSPRCGPNGPEA